MRVPGSSGTSRAFGDTSVETSTRRGFLCSQLGSNQSIFETHKCHKAFQSLFSTQQNNLHPDPNHKLTYLFRTNPAQQDSCIAFLLHLQQHVTRPRADLDHITSGQATKCLKLYQVSALYIRKLAAACHVRPQHTHAHTHTQFTHKHIRTWLRVHATANTLLWISLVHPSCSASCLFHVSVRSLADCPTQPQAATTSILHPHSLSL